MIKAGLVFSISKIFHADKWMIFSCSSSALPATKQLTAEAESGETTIKLWEDNLLGGQ